MLKSVGIFLVAIFGVYFNVQSQDMWEGAFTIYDTIPIQEVEIVSPVSEKFQIGSKNEVFSSMQRQNTSSGTLTNLLSRYTPIYIKSDAGSLASFKLRGTSSNHTSVLIGGLDINSLTLGSTNASSIPVFLFDNIALTYGSSSATIGSGSIGGSVRLGFNNNYKNGFNSEIIASHGSFGEYAYGAKVFAGNGKLESVTRLYHYQKQNNFPFVHDGNYNFETEQYDKIKLKQKHAAIDKKHLVQQFNYKINERQSLRSFIWFEETWYQIQPTISEIASQNSPASTYEDRNLFSWVDYNHNLQPFDLHVGSGYVTSKAVSNGDNNNLIQTNRLVSEIDIKKNYQFLKLKAGLKYKHIVPRVYAYAEEIKKEEHFDMYSSIYYRVSTNLKTTLNLRQQFVTNFKAPFTPALGMEYILATKRNSITKLTGNIQRTYKVATLNDRYWNQPGEKGNTNIKPEEGINYEGGIGYAYHGKVTLKSNASYYYMNVNNWLTWIQGANGFQAINDERVVSQGIELHTDVNLNTGKVNWEWGINYALNQAIIKEAVIMSKINQQLIYTPRHLGNSFLNISVNDYNLGIDAAYTGNRTHTYAKSNALLDAYFLTNITLGKNISFKTHSLTIHAQVNNLFNTTYQNQYRYAMPGINYRFSMIYKFNNTKTEK